MNGIVGACSTCRGEGLFIQNVWWGKLKERDLLENRSLSEDVTLE
jgi:hypothetical protein